MFRFIVFLFFVEHPHKHFVADLTYSVEYP